MKILIINDYSSALGGVETYLSQLEPLLSAAGCSVEMFILEDFNYLKSDRHAISRLKEKISVFQDLKTKLKRTVETFKPDIIHLHNVQAYPTTIFSTLKERDVPVIQNIHDLYQFNQPDDSSFSPFSYARAQVSKYLRKQQLHNVQHFICHSTYIYRQLIETVDSEIVTHIPLMYGGDIMEDFPLFKDRENKLLYVGRIKREKGIYFLIETFLKADILSDYELYIAGKGADDEKFSALVDDYENITYLGFSRDLEKHYQNAKILIVPSIWQEPFGIVGLEGMAHGSAIIASDVGGIPEWCVDNETGLLYESENHDALLSALRDCLTNTEQTQSRIFRARDYLKQNYSPENHMEHLLGLYHSLMNDNSLKR